MTATHQQKSGKIVRIAENKIRKAQI